MPVGGAINRALNLLTNTGQSAMSQSYLQDGPVEPAGNLARLLTAGTRVVAQRGSQDIDLCAAGKRC